MDDLVRFKIRLRNNSTGKIRGIFAQRFKSELENLFKKELDIIVATIGVGSKTIDYESNIGGRTNLQITTFNKSHLKELVSKFFQMRLSKKPLIIDNKEFTVLDLLFYDIGSNNIESDKINIDFSSPYIMKVGDRFLDRFEPVIFWKDIYKQNKLRNQILISKSEFIDIIKDVNITELEERIYNLKLNKFIVPAIRGSYEIDISNINDCNKSLIKASLQIANHLGVGTYSNYGFGHYYIKIVQETIMK